MAWLNKIIDKDVQLAWIDKSKSIGVERYKHTQKIIIESNQKKDGIFANIKNAIFGISIFKNFQ